MLPEVDERMLDRAMEQPWGERFVAKILINTSDGDGCWLWTGYKLPGVHGGYGQFTIDRKLRYAHRLAVELSAGIELTSEQFACHRCDRPSCVRASHLFVGTAADNALDAARKNRLASVLTPAEVLDICRRSAAGDLGSAIARDLKISEATVSRILSGERWSHLTGRYRWARTAPANTNAGEA